MNGQILEREIRTPLQIAEEVFPLTEGLLPQLHMDRLDQVLTRGPHSDVERVSLQPIDRKAVDETGLENERERARPAGFREKVFVERRHAITRRALVAFPKPGGIGCARLVGVCRRTRHSSVSLRSRAPIRPARTPWRQPGAWGRCSSEPP